eukprot:3939857-Rhodomonas_salina.1
MKHARHVRIGQDNLSKIFFHFLLCLCASAESLFLSALLLSSTSSPADGPSSFMFISRVIAVGAASFSSRQASL